MAKKKKTKNSEAEKIGFSAELTGLILILIGIIGFWIWTCWIYY